MNSFITRTISGAVYVALMVGTIYSGRMLENTLYGTLIAAVVFMAIGLIGTSEVIRNLAKKGVTVSRGTTFVVASLTYITVCLAYVTGYMEIGLALPAIWLVAFLVQLWRNDEAPFACIGYTLLPSLWVMVPLALIPFITSISEGLIMMIFILIWVNDSFAYMSGRLLGKHKMWERHSPNKTWEGTIGGALFCIVAAVLVGPLFDREGLLMFGVVEWVIIALICSIIGTLGDLVESMFKRYCGVKDSGNIMPGHGGVLDRFDSILATVPVIVAYISILNISFQNCL